MKLLEPIRSIKIYVLFLFLGPSLIFTFSLLSGYDLPILSVLSSEKFWIYLVEHKRSLSQGLLAWPGLIDFDFLYLERLLPRLILFPFDSKIYFVIDSLLSFLLIFCSINFAISRFFNNKNIEISRLYILFLFVIQPFYLIKAFYFDSYVIELWWSRNLVASLAIVFFLFSILELHIKRNLTTSLILCFFLGLTHIYSFILLACYIGLYLVISIFLRSFNDMKDSLNSKSLLINFFSVIGILAIIANTLHMEGQQELSYFFARYIPERNETELRETFFHELMYLVPLLFICLLSIRFLKIKDKNINLFLEAISLVIFSALVITILFFLFFPGSVNIHFRIYIIEPLILFFCGVLFSEYLTSFFRLSVRLLILISLILPLTLIQFSKSIHKIDPNKISSVHRYFFINNLDDCQCTVFDPGSHEFLIELERKNEIDFYIKQQWSNALIHKESFFQ